MLRTPIAGPIEFLGVGRSTTVLLIEKGCRLRLASGGLPESMIATRACHPTVYIGNWLSLLPGLVHPDAREALVVGLGGSLVVEALPSSFERADVVELEAEVLRANRHVAGLRARDPLADPRVRVHIREARGALRLSSKRYDVIVSQPSHPWTAGSSNLYTREFFDLVRSRLDDRGLFVQWIGIAFVDDALLRTLVATLFDVFPHVQIYQPNPQALLFVASADPIDGLAGARVALARFPEAYERYGIAHVEDLAARLLLDEQDAREFARGAAVNTDDLNLLSTRAPDLGSAALEPKALDALVAPYDTLLEEVPDLDRGFVLRRMLSIGLTGRAARLVEKLPPLEADIGAGWIALNARRPRTATLAFERALERDPDSGQALVGLVLSQKVAIARGSVPARIEAAALSPETRAVIEGWQREKRGDVLAVRDLEPQLERIGEDQPLYESATRLRIRWRLASSDLERAAEALRLATRLVVPFEAPEDVLLRAEAAEAAGEIDTAWASLEQLDAQLARARPAKLMSRAQELAQRLPDSPAERGLRARLAGRAR